MVPGQAGVITACNLSETNIFRPSFSATARPRIVQWAFTRSMSARTIVALLILLVSPAAAEDIFASRPAFSAPDQPAKTFATCDQVGPMSEGLPVMDERIDLSVVGELTLVKTDGALWYLVMCSDVRIMCVTYQSNGMQVGERVFMKGGYRRLDERHAVLDPCLASREDSDAVSD